MLPQLGVGAWTPRPRKLNADSVRIAWATPNVAATTIEGTAWGRTCRARMRGCVAPSARAAPTNSRAVVPKISLRTARPTVI
jgi:hypothetical protein